MCSTSSAYGERRERSFGRTDRAGQALGVEARDAGDPAAVGVVERSEQRCGSPGQLHDVVVGRWTAEVAGVAFAEDTDRHVTEPPRDRRHRRRRRLRELEVHDQIAGADRRLGACLRSRTDAPATFDRLPEVLVVGEGVEPGSYVVVPMPRQLLAQAVRPFHWPWTLRLYMCIP